MTARYLAVGCGVLTVSSWVLFGVSVPAASAEPCPDVQVVFARGTTEVPGIGPTGEAFVDSLRTRIGAKSLGVYPVDYPATLDFPTAVTGIHDATDHVQNMAATCPDTDMVLGGYSQGAAVMGFVTSNVIPDGAPQGVPNPMPPEVAERVAAVALFGKPNNRFMSAINEPLIEVGPLYADKTIDLCVPADPICDTGGDFAVHTPVQYVQTGMINQAVTFASGRLLAEDIEESDPVEHLDGSGPVEHLAGRLPG
jgi:cutinase